MLIHVSAQMVVEEDLSWLSHQSPLYILRQISQWAKSSLICLGWVASSKLPGILQSSSAHWWYDRYPLLSLKVVPHACATNTWLLWVFWLNLLSSHIILIFLEKLVSFSLYYFLVFFHYLLSSLSICKWNFRGLEENFKWDLKHNIYSFKFSVYSVSAA